MRGESLIAHSHRLREAVRWLDRQTGDGPAVVDEACQRFDLSPADEAFLQRMWRERRQPPGSRDDD